MDVVDASLKVRVNTNSFPTSGIFTDGRKDREYSYRISMPEKEIRHKYNKGRLLGRKDKRGVFYNTNRRPKV